MLSTFDLSSLESWNFRLARASDEKQIVELYHAASNYLKVQGVDQWQDGYPNAESFRDDINLGNSYVLELLLGNQRMLAGTMFFHLGADAGYEAENEHLWSYHGSYGVIHRLAIHPVLRGTGLSRLFYYYASKRAIQNKVYALRVDTHENNIPMQRSLEQVGFVNRGPIRFSRTKDEAPIDRIAYECLELDKITIANELAEKERKINGQK